MNQILSTNMPMDNKKKQRRNREPVDISNVLKFFAISIMVFGVLMVGAGTYAIYKNQSEQEEQNLEPTISIENKTDTTILLKVMHKKNIVKVVYSWNDGEENVINGNNGKYVEKQIDIPAGKNTLHILVQDETGKEITYEKQYELESGINFEVSGDKIRITYQGNKIISYMTYRWDDEEEKTIEINDTNIDQEIDALKGLHTLTVVTVDENNDTDTKVQKINGVSKPDLIIDIDSELKHFIIKASDEEKLSKIEFTLNYEDQVYELNLEEMNLKELDYTLQMEFEQGENIIQVTVYNSNGISNQKGAKFVKQ